MTTTAPDELEATGEIWAPPPEPAKPARPPRRPLNFWFRLLSQFLLMLAVGLIGLAGYLIVVTPVQQSNDQDRLYATYREQLAAATAPTGGLIDPGLPVALLAIPGLGFNQVVVQGTASGDLEAGPGHLRNTPLPGQAGTSVIYGKSATFGAPFQQIDRLQAGDRIEVTTGQGAFTYRVIDVRRPGDPSPSTLAKGAGRLTLVTSQGANLLQRGDILLVDADLLDQPQPTPSGQPSLIPREELAMESNMAIANLGLVLWLQALGLALAGVVWARQRWGKREALVVGVPIVVAIVWNLYETVGQLLPNLV
ncbi:sortase [Amycolatopsis sp. GM8]|uniref:sortase n=1 Tax=Amycolatopsis sp. GM8 TaxID=2896530 RepID=UPI001F2E69DD|nr:sortase [Amycolatopsis sp. GM8]